MRARDPRNYKSFQSVLLLSFNNKKSTGFFWELTGREEQSGFTLVQQDPDRFNMSLHTCGAAMIEE